MKFINYISEIAIPFTIFFIVIYGFSEKIKVFDSFLVRSKRRNKNGHKDISNTNCSIFSN